TGHWRTANGSHAAGSTSKNRDKTKRPAQRRHVTSPNALSAPVIVAMSTGPGRGSVRLRRAATLDVTSAWNALRISSAPARAYSAADRCVDPSHQRIGRAQAVGLELDAVSIAGVLGTLAGDDTVLVIPKSTGGTAELARKLRELAGL